MFMGTNQYSLAINTLKKYNKEIMHLTKLKQIIRINLASDEKRIMKYLQMMRDAGLITETSNFMFKITTDNVEEILKT